MEDLGADINNHTMTTLRLILQGVASCYWSELMHGCAEAVASWHATWYINQLITTNRHSKHVRIIGLL